MFKKDVQNMKPGKIFVTAEVKVNLLKYGLFNNKVKRKQQMSLVHSNPHLLVSRSLKEKKKILKWLYEAIVYN